MPDGRVLNGYTPWTEERRERHRTRMVEQNKAKARPWQERFWSKVDKNGPVMDRKLGACWEWIPAQRHERRPTGLMFKTGNGREQMSPYRWIYLQEVGPIPDGYDVDHVCENWRCVRPTHLEAVTPKENIDRYYRGRG